MKLYDYVVEKIASVMGYFAERTVLKYAPKTDNPKGLEQKVEVPKK